MPIYVKQCESDEEFAKVSLFFLTNKFGLHPSISTIDAVTLLYLYITQGYLIYSSDDSNQVIGVCAYYHGTPEQEYKDKHVAFMDMALSDKAHQGTRLFVKGLIYLVDHIAEHHPEVEDLQLAALTENTYTCRLYAKFAEVSHTRDGYVGQETVFCVKIHQIQGFLRKYR
ncbi:hypothetical protein [Paenibacillus hexagrammi]|uniref:N-acetyltransferase domain-containing protein n=1 Tax=Paenibacillus hexagrammi TaxID=2908839 RepID=A0ABY3SL46_9BACL|nr:hypothetical protein [Paenibacillus sp. YPD9-1]UJF33850.1 hypothetical protein L0M14_00870 [Paenibacillus sp. YPD9-1]